MNSEANATAIAATAAVMAPYNLEILAAAARAEGYPGSPLSPLWALRSALGEARWLAEALPRLVRARAFAPVLDALCSLLPAWQLQSPEPAHPQWASPRIKLRPLLEAVLRGGACFAAAAVARPAGPFAALVLAVRNELAFWRDAWGLASEFPETDFLETAKGFWGQTLAEAAECLELLLAALRPTRG